MKYLREYADNSTDNLEKACRDIFAELIDSKDVIIGTDERYYGVGSRLIKYVVIVIPKKEPETLEKYIDRLESLKDVLEDVNVGLKRLKDEFSDVNVEFYMEYNYYNENDKKLDSICIDISLHK